MLLITYKLKMIDIWFYISSALNTLSYVYKGGSKQFTCLRPPFMSWLKCKDFGLTLVNELVSSA